jgi:nucleotide-binding universal stress UspA family protein
MNILVATDGVLDPQKIVDAVGRWYEDGDMVTVFTAVNIPTEFLHGLGESGVQEAARIAKEAGQTLGAGDRAAERLVGVMHTQGRAKTDSPVLRALASTAASRTKSAIKALADNGIEAKPQWRTSENRTASTIISVIRELDAGIVIVGSHGHGRFEGMLGSTVTKLARHAPCSVLILRNPTAKR